MHVFELYQCLNFYKHFTFYYKIGPAGSIGSRMSL